MESCYLLVTICLWNNDKVWKWTVGMVAQHYKLMPLNHTLKMIKVENFMLNISLKTRKEIVTSVMTSTHPVSSLTS